MAIVGEVEDVTDRTKDSGIPAKEPEAKESKDYYAWSNLEYGAEVSDSGHITTKHVIEYGSKVTQKDLGCSDENWQRLVELRVVRKSVPPKVGRYESPKRKLIADASKQMETALAGGE